VVATWDGRYLLDFEKVLGETTLRAGSEDIIQDDEPKFSLITGKYRQVKKYGDQQSAGQIGEAEGALVRRNQEGTITKPAYSGEHLSGRTWRGLEQNLGQDEPGLLEQGRSGLAKGYHEVDHPQRDNVP
jgi:diphthamide biosynthesis protein 2